MWLEPYKDKYRAIERYIDHMTGKYKRVSTIIDKDTKASRKAAEIVLRAKIESLCAIKRDDNITLKELIDKYLIDQKRTLKASSYTSTAAHMRYISEIFDTSILVSMLTAGYVYDRITGKSSTPYMTNRNILYFKAMINWAFDHDYVSDKAWIDKIKRVKTPKPVSKVEDHFLESTELRTLINAIPQKHWKLLTQFLALSGLRIGEVIALTDADIDDYIHVNKTYHSGTGVLNDTPKTDSSTRNVFVQPELATVIWKIRTYKNEVMIRTGVRNDIFFPMPDGSIISYDAYQKRLKKYSIESLNRPVSPHMLRHTHTSLLAEAGVPLEAISRRLGHHDSKITAEVYLHVTKKKKKFEESLISHVKIL